MNSPGGWSCRASGINPRSPFILLPGMSRIQVLPLPFALPPLFAEQLGYRGDLRFIAAYWHSPTDRVTVRDDRSRASGGGDWHPWTTFFYRTEVLRWRWQHDIYLGSSAGAATHWLI